MSAPPAQGSQNPPPQPQQQAQLLKADDLSKLQCLTDDQKQKYRPVLQNFWQMMQNKAPGSPEHTQAHTKLREWSQKLIGQERIHRQKMKMQQQAQGQQNSQNSQSSQSMQQPPPSGNDQGQHGQPAQAPKPQNIPQQQPQPLPQAAQQGQPQANRPPGVPQNLNQPNPEILKHVENFPYQLPPGAPPLGSPEADAKLKDLRNNYLVMLTRQERARMQASNLNNMLKQRESAGHELPQELLARKSSLEAEYNNTKKFVDEFRKKQAEYKNANEQRTAQRHQGSAPQAQGQQAQAQPQPQPPPQNAIKQEPQVKIEGGQPPPQPAQFGNMQGGGAAQQQHLQQNQAAPAPSVAQQQPRPPPGPHSQAMAQLPQQNQMPFAPPGQQAHPSRPQINPQQANAHAQQQNNSPHPQSATTSGGQPVPLSHQAAMSAVNRSYSNPEPQRTGSIQAQGNFHAPGSREREQMNNPKMPIPRQLNVTSPVPVQMQQARPTMGGPTNGAPGPMGQPVINKFPPFQLEGDGDRVLSKRKLDELVRQVTGSSEDALTPEVEEAMLQLADEFVDNVVTSACKLAKLRESTHLEVRDLQLILERNYNIRIPGYSSDEVRTVRKLVPAPGWTQKMNAVQAAKVMGGKTDI